MHAYTLQPTPFLTSPQDDLERDFRTFHRSNPHIYRELERLALARAISHRGRIGVKAIVEQMREAGYRISNTHTAFYARLLLHNNPRLRGRVILRYTPTDERTIR
jgi:hypothetical protein